jgi:hypothetical protein
MLSDAQRRQNWNDEDHFDAMQAFTLYVIYLSSEFITIVRVSPLTM